MNFFDEKKRLSILDSTFSFILSSLLPLSLFHSERFLINNYFITAALSFLLILVCIRKAVASLYIKITSIDILFVAVLITSITSSIVNETSFNSTFNIKFIIYACLFLLMKDILNYKKTVVYFHISNIFTNLFFAVAIIIFLITRNDYTYFIEERFANTGVFSIYLSVSSIFLFDTLKRNIREKRYCILLLLFMVNIGLIFLLKSRISIIIIIIGGYLLFIHMSHLKKLKGKTGIILSAFIVIFVFVFFTLCVKRDSSEGRLLILKISSKMIYEHMLIGAGGFNSYTTTYPLYQMEYFSSENGTEKEVMLADNMQFALNEPIQFICELGIIGGIFIFMIAYKMIEYIKIRKILCTALTVIFFASGFYYILHITIFQNILFILSLIAGIQGKAIMKPASTKTAFIITFLTFIVSLSSTSFSFIKFRTSQKVKYGIERGYGLDDKYCQSIEKFKDNPQFLLSYARQLFNKRNYYGCINVLDDLTLLTIHSDVECLKGKCYLYINSFEEAERCFIKASNICPNRFEYRYELYKLYFEKNQLDKAIEIALSIRNLKEKIPSTYTFAIKLEIERFLNDNCSNCGE